MILIYAFTMRSPVLRSVAVVLGVLGAMACSSCTTVTPPTTGVITVVAAEAQWGSIAAAIGGNAVRVTNIIDNPTIDPHSYEPSPTDADAIAHADLVIVNGIGYDPWATELAAAAGGRVHVLNIGAALGFHPGDNPHQWYDLDAVRKEIPAIIAGALNAVRPQLEASGRFDAGAVGFTNGPYRAVGTLEWTIASTFRGTRVGASESIASPLARSLSLNLVTPPSFLRAMSEGGEPTAADLATIDRQLRSRSIAVYLDNTQNQTPVVTAQVALCHRMQIPVVTVTETPPAHQSYVAWQTRQLTALLAALTAAKDHR